MTLGNGLSIAKSRLQPQFAQVMNAPYWSLSRNRAPLHLGQALSFKSSISVPHGGQQGHYPLAWPLQFVILLSDTGDLLLSGVGLDRLDGGNIQPVFFVKVIGFQMMTSPADDQIRQWVCETGPLGECFGVVADAVSPVVAFANTLFPGGLGLGTVVVPGSGTLPGNLPLP
jgi:hypothetical protein